MKYLILILTILFFAACVTTPSIKEDAPEQTFKHGVR